MTTAERSKPAWLAPDASFPQGVHAISTLRSGGHSTGAFDSLNLAYHVGDDTSAVAANRRLLAGVAALPEEPLWLEQVHGTTVVEHEGAHVGATPPRADAAVTFEPGRVCVIMTADCLPVVFSDRAGTRIGIAHAGWRGLVGGVLEATIAALRRDPSQLLAWLGPAIGPAAFEVGPEVRAAFVARNPENAHWFAANPAGPYQADIYGLARAALHRAGVSNVSGGGECTSTDADRFFSFRRDRVTGRMATLAWFDRTS